MGRLRCSSVGAGRPALLLLIMAAVAVLAAGCDSTTEPASASGDGGGAVTTYGGIGIAVTGTEVSSEPPEDDDSDGSWIYLDVALESALEDTTVTFPAQLFVLRSAEGDVTPAEGWLTDELRDRYAIEPQERSDTRLVFPAADDLDLDSLELHVEERGKEPAIIPLDGGQWDAPVPSTIDITGSRATVTANQPAHHDVDVEPLGVTASLDWRSQRVDRDHYFVIVTTRAHGLTSSLGGTNVFKSMFRLDVDGVMRGPADFEGPGLLDEGVSEEYTAVYQVPADTNAMTLVVGDPDGEQVRYEITFEPPTVGDSA